MVNVVCLPSEVMGAWMVRVWVNGVEVGLWSGNIWYVLVVVFVWWSKKLETMD